jgi:RNA polymerase-interacting CarD/CdnL/TRCF family regulator
LVEADPALKGLPEPGEPVFYPKVGHCIYRGVTEDRVAPGTRLLELEDLEEGSRILIPLARVPELNLRPAGLALDDIKDILSAEFEEPMEDEDARHELVEELIADGSPRALAQALKRLHLVRQTSGLSREEEQTRKKVRSWLAAEVSISKECTRAEAQAFMTRALQDSMAAHRQKEKEEAKERRRAAKEQKKAEKEAEREAAAEAEALAASEANTESLEGDELDSTSPSEVASEHPVGKERE